MGFYSNVIFPGLYDWLMDKPYLARHRQEQLAGVAGEVLEIGVGTGLNLPHYPDSVRQITTVDPNPGMNKKLKKRMDETGMEVDQRVISSEELPLDDATFDCIVSTITLCSIPQVERALAELFRVLKPGGRFVFLEHGLCPEPDVQKWQQRLNWFQRLVADGCRLDLNVRAVLAEQPFQSVEVENFYLEETPKTHGYMYRGTAVK